MKRVRNTGVAARLHRIRLAGQKRALHIAWLKLRILNTSLQKGNRCDPAARTRIEAVRFEHIPICIALLSNFQLSKRNFLFLRRDQPSNHCVSSLVALQISRNLGSSMVNNGSMFTNVQAVPFNISIRVEIITVAVVNLIGANAALAYVKPAYDSALADVTAYYPHLSVRQHVITDNGKYRMCGEVDLGFDNLLGQFYFTNEARWKAANLTVFIGGVIDCKTEIVGLFGNALKKLTMTSSRLQVRQSSGEKTEWPSWLVTGASVSRESRTKTVTDFLSSHSWTTLAIVCDTTRQSPFCSLAEFLRQTMKRGVRNSVIQIDGLSDTTDYAEVVQKLNRDARVFLLFCFSTTVRKLMLAAHAVNLTNGEQVYVAPVPFGRATSGTGNYSWDHGDSENQKAKQAYRSLFLLEPDIQGADVPGSENYRLADHWRHMTKEKFNFSYNEVSVTAFGAYTAVMMLAEVLTELTKAGETAILNDGVAIARHFLNRWFHLRTGDAYMDSSGERVVTFSCNQYNSNGTLVTVSARDPQTQIFVDVAEVDWPGFIWPVPNRPRCGYDGKDLICRRTADFGAVSGLATAGAFLLLAGVLRALWIKYQRDFHSWWAIEPALFESTLKFVRYDAKRDL